MDYNISVSTEEEVKLIHDSIINFNKQKVPCTHGHGFINLDFNIKNENGLVIAGINSKCYYLGVLFIDVLFVNEEYRGQKLGSFLLNHVEQKAKLMNECLSNLETFDWQCM